MQAVVDSGALWGVELVGRRNVSLHFILFYVRAVFTFIIIIKKNPKNVIRIIKRNLIPESSVYQMEMELVWRRLRQELAHLPLPP